MNGTMWVEQTMAKIEAKEDEIYASIGAYDPDAFKAYLANEHERLTKIAEDLTSTGYDWNMAYPYGNLDHTPPQPEATNNYDPNLSEAELAAQIERHGQLGETPEFVAFERKGWSLSGDTYDEYRHDPDSIGFDDSYTGPSERELMGGCNRCGGMDDCYCPSPEEIRQQEEEIWEARTERANR